MVLTQTDKLILQSYQASIEGLANFLGNGYEFVLHSLENLDNSVIKIINGYYSGRKEGAPITDLALSMLTRIETEQKPEYITYFNKNHKGEPLKSITIAIRGEKARIIGVFCINFFLNTPLHQLLDNLLIKEQQDLKSESFSENTTELIESAIRKATEFVAADESIPLTYKNREIITLLYNQGIFNLKDAVPQIASVLNLSKNTVYMHLRLLKGKTDHPSRNEIN